MNSSYVKQHIQQNKNKRDNKTQLIYSHNSISDTLFIPNTAKLTAFRKYVVSTKICKCCFEID